MKNQTGRCFTGNTLNDDLMSDITSKTSNMSVNVV
jgi:hypothetical protein